MYVPGNSSDPADELILSAFECAINILQSAGARRSDDAEFNAYQLDLFTFKDMDLGRSPLASLQQCSSRQSSRHRNWELLSKIVLAMRQSETR